MNYKIINEETVYNGYLQVRKGKICHEISKDGRQTILTREKVHRGDTCAILLHDSDHNSFILTRQFRYPTIDKSDGWLTEIVAGNVEDGESPEESILREVNEEVGYSVENMIKISSYFTSPGRSTEYMTLYFAQVISKGKLSQGGGSKKESEHIEVIEIPIIEAKELLYNDEFQDVKTILALNWYFSNQYQNNKQIIQNK